jgi:hypothetical protein
MRGADFDWRYRGWEEAGANLGLQRKPRRVAKKANTEKVTGASLAEDTGPDHWPLLKGVEFAVQKGELLGICGEVRGPVVDGKSPRRNPLVGRRTGNVSGSCVGSACARSFHRDWDPLGA